MQDGDRVAEARAEAADRLRRERDLGHEHDRAAPALERPGARLEVHLGLPAPRRPVQEDVAPARVERGLDAGDGLDLSLGQLLRLGLAREPAALGGHPPLAAACPRPRRDERERPGGSRPVVVREPERELDERGRHAVDDGAGGGELDAVRRPDADVDDDASHASGCRGESRRRRPRSTSSATSYVNARASDRAVTSG